MKLYRNTETETLYRENADTVELRDAAGSWQPSALSPKQFTTAFNRGVFYEVADSEELHPAKKVTP